MNHITTRAVGVLAALALTVASCGGSDASNTDDGASDASDSVEDGTTEQPEGEVDSADGSDDANSDASSELPAVEVPANWDPSMPSDAIDGMTLTFAGVRGDGAEAIYELQYDGTGQDGEALFDTYEALVLAAGWAEADQATPLIGSFSMEDRTLVITTFGGDASQIIVSAAPN